MTEEEKKALLALVKADAEERETKNDSKLDKVLSCMDAVMNRMDAFEDKFKKDTEKEEEDAKEVAADKAKKDAEEAEKEKADKAKKDAEEAETKAKKDAEDEKEEEKKKADSLSAIQKRIDAVEKALPKERPDSEHRQMADAQAAADSVYHAFNDSAPRFLNGETLGEYRRRLVTKFKDMSPAWKAVDVGALSDDAVFEVAEKAIYADALTAARNPSSVEDGALRMTRRQTASGHTMISFDGRPRAWLNRFAGTQRAVTKIDTLKKGAA